MNDKELLELAAKAAGVEATGYCVKLGIQYVNGSDDSPFTDYWNPLTDDGDALRLAVLLELNIDICSDCTCVAGWPDLLEDLEELHGHDRYASTRRAIVRAAAEIGKEMK